MKHKNIFSRQNQTILKLFERAGHPRKVLCIVLDYAKVTHTALCCNGTGKVLKNPFPVKNNPAGLELLLETVDKLCRKHQICREHVFFGGEDCGTFTLNMIYNLRGVEFMNVPALALLSCPTTAVFLNGLSDFPMRFFPSRRG